MSKPYEHGVLVDIQGHGTVGKAMKHIFSDCFHENYMDDVDAVIITNHEDYLYDVITDVKKWHIGLIIIKCTVRPDMLKKIMGLHDKICYVPEFLREKTSLADAEFPAFRIFGGTKENIALAERIFAAANSHPQRIFHMSAEEASFVKYSINCYLAMKVAFFNELYDLAKKHDMNWYNISQAVIADERIGSSHTAVPGHDGEFGFGGKCLPKDLDAFIDYSGIELLHAVRSSNDGRRKLNQKWEDPLGYGY